MIKKIFFFFLGLVALALIGLFFFGSTILNKGVVTAVETIGPKVTQTDVSIQEVDLSLLSGSGSLSGIRVGNPEGYKSETIFELDKIDVEVDTKSLVGDTMVVEKVHIMNPKISYEKTLKGSNLKELQKNIEAFIANLPGANTMETIEDTEASKDAKPPKKVIIKDFKVEGGTVYASLMGAGLEVPLPRIEFANIGAKDGPSYAEMGKEIFNKIIDSVAKAGGKSVDALSNTGQKALDTTKKQVIDRASKGLMDMFGQ